MERLIEDLLDVNARVEYGDITMNDIASQLADIIVELEAIYEEQKNREE